MALHEDVTAWLDGHNDAGISLSGFQPAMFLEVATANGASASGVAASAVITGAGAAADIESSAQLKTVSKTDPDGAKVTFATRPMDGCTSLLNISRTASGFEPSQGMTGDNLDAYKRYISSVQACPLFNIDMSDSVTVSLESDDYDMLINAVADTFDGIKDDDKNKIKEGVTKLVKAAASNSDQSETTDLFVQNVLNSADGIYQIYIYSSHVTLVHHESKGHSSTQENYTITRTKMTFRSTDWPSFSDRVWDKQYSSVTDWLDQNTTADGGKKNLVTCL